MKLLENTSGNYSSDELEQIKLFYEAHKKDLNNLEQKILPKLSNPYEKELLSNLIADDGDFVEFYDQGLSLKEIVIYMAIFILLSMGRELILGDKITDPFYPYTTFP